MDGASPRLRWRKFSPIDRKFPVYELLEGEVVILDITKGDAGTLEMAFHEGASGRSFDLAAIEEMIAEAKSLLQEAAGQS